MIPFPQIQIPRDPNDPRGTVLNRIAQALTATFGSLKNVVTNDFLVGNKPRTPIGAVRGPVRMPIAVTDTKVYHGLGHVVQTWEICDIDAAATVYQSASHNAAPAQYIILKASAPVNVLLRFT